MVRVSEYESEDFLEKPDGTFHFRKGAVSAKAISFYLNTVAVFWKILIVNLWQNGIKYLFLSHNIHIL